MGFFGGSSVDLTSPGPIGSTTPNTGRFTTLTLAPSANTTPFTASGYSLTGTNAQSLFDLSGTWNTTGTPTAFKLNVTDTASNASSLLMDLQVGGSSKASIDKTGLLLIPLVGSRSAPTLQVRNANSGIYSPANSWIGFACNGASPVQIANNLLVLTSGATFGWSNQVNDPSQTGSSDLSLARDAADTFAQRRSTNAQTFRLYNTYTDASNYERGFFRWNSNVLEVGAENAGTGSNRVLRLYAGIDDGIEFYIGTRVMSVKQQGGFSQIYYTSSPWLISASVVGSGNTNFVAQPVQINAGRGTGSGANGYIQFRASPSGSSGTAQHPALEEAFRISVPATGGAFCSFGGTTSSFPALKRSSAVLQARLADDSGFAQVQGKLTTDTNYTTTAPSATGYLTIYDASGTAYKVLCST